MKAVGCPFIWHSIAAIQLAAMAIHPAAAGGLGAGARQNSREMPQYLLYLSTGMMHGTLMQGVPGMLCMCDVGA
jgi:IMP dehydrogenase/GMP reductase